MAELVKEAERRGVVVVTKVFVEGQEVALVSVYQQVLACEWGLGKALKLLG